MWNEKQENIILPGQTTCTPKRLQGAHVGNKILPLPSEMNDIDFLGGSSRKRKSTAMYPPGATSEYCIAWESSPREPGPLMVLNGQGNNHGVPLNRTKLVEPVNFNPQFGNDQFQYQNDFSETWPTSNVNFHRTGNENISHTSLSVLPQSLHHKGPLPLFKLPAGETLTVPNRQIQACYEFGQTQADRSLPFLKSCDADTKKAQIGPDLQDLMNFGITNYVVQDKMPLEISNTSSEHLRAVDILHQSFVQPNMFSDSLNRRTCSQEGSKFGISFELKRSGQCASNDLVNDIPTVGRASVGASVYIEPNENSRSLENEVQFGSAPLGICLGDSSESKEQSHWDADVKVKERTVASGTQRPKYSLTEDISSKSGGSPNNPLKLDEKSDVPSGKDTSMVTEKLWDGSLQLNSSVTMSAVAFFKSGEKLPDINWSEFVEVKGKVRLEAFEKYIQDLPRSRNRGLMVISICWKEGSSETGLTGMKEVAKGYRKGGRVGFAHLSPGIDIYICPRSDTIITILAKHGFFKGMAAIEDNQDSLIGCVVWRKNQTSSNLVPKKSESKNNSLPEPPLNSPSASSTKQVAENKFFPTQPAQQSNQSIPLKSVTSSSTQESAGENDSESKNTKSSEVQLRVANFSSDANTLLTSSVPNNSSSIPVGQQKPPLLSSPLQGSNGHLLEAEASCISCSGAEQPKMSLGLQNPVISLPSNVMKQMVPTYCDDDLPEYDFGTACAIATNPMSSPLDAVMLDRRLPAEGIRNMDGLGPSTMPVVQAISVSNQRSDNSSHPRISSVANQGIPLLEKVCEHGPRINNFCNSEEKSVQSKATPMPVSVAAFASPKNSFGKIPKKNLFEDDDDMPEWCFPELHKQSLVEAIKPLTILPPQLSNTTFQNISPGPLLHLLPSPSPAATHSVFSSQVFHPALHCPTISVKATQPTPFQSGPRSPMGFNPNPLLRPPSTPIDVKLPFQCGYRRDQRP